MRVLVVEDDRALSRALSMNLTARGHQVSEAASGAAALGSARVEPPDAVILDLGLPDVSGLEVIRSLRQFTPAPIIVLSARSSSGEKVAALDLGADDYVTKPFNVDELLARLRAAARRVPPPEAPRLADLSGTVVDFVAKTVTGRDGAPVHLTPTEWRLLETLARRPGTLVTGRALLTQLRGGPEHTDPSYLRIYVGQLRRKLEPEPGRPRHLITEPGMGYRFQP
ncbi:response regulator [Jatrophihabitans cynanchi]|jgi:two-component system KDP operon response regulator KdpE|uniref:Response regulator n=1 Tax=Jatrophihabitans cynanchi TaxID=2944128 RepID=A0ABY7JS35_9ACTN|nr:response regulator [Jatrophihabitans sp. SB3-54]WAX55375.1 response regulator [Jatrophihabitans sp. SB3-54]